MHNVNNKERMKDKIKKILVEVYGIDGRHENEATERICALFNVSEKITLPEVDPNKIRKIIVG